MKKILTGGSPCTHWSIAKTKNRETKAKGLGWELFKNYLISLEKYKPDYFIYENNKSMSKEIRASIDEAFGFEAVFINSALVSAQNRQRLYWVGRRNADGTYSKVNVEQPEDRGILLKDILETGTDLSQNAKAYYLTASYDGAVAWNTIEKSQRTMVAEPIEESVTLLKAIPEIAEKFGYLPEMFNAYNRAKITDKAPTLSTGSMVTSSCAVNKLEPVSVRCRGREIDAGKKCVKGEGVIEQFYEERTDGKTYPIYEVKDGQITIKDKQYPIKLADGYYIIRKLTVTECMRLQTVPEGFKFPVSNTQAYKMLGNGWTIEVIKHILSHIPNYTAHDFEVLSMYDGMACAYVALKEMGVNISKYYATEIDKWAIQTSSHNFPDIIQMGDAFQVREDDWRI